MFCFAIRTTPCTKTPCCHSDTSHRHRTVNTKVNTLHIKYTLRPGDSLYCIPVFLLLVRSSVGVVGVGVGAVFIFRPLLILPNAHPVSVLVLHPRYGCCCCCCVYVVVLLLLCIRVGGGGGVVVVVLLFCCCLHISKFIRSNYILPNDVVSTYTKCPS